MLLIEILIIFGIFKSGTFSNKYLFDFDKHFFRGGIMGSDIFNNVYLVRKFSGLFIVFLKLTR